MKRYKKAFKCLSFYVNNFGFFKPFQLLIDGTFCYAALQNRIQIRQDVPKYFRSEVKFLTTLCMVLESEKLGTEVTPVMKIIKNFGVHNCGHGKKPLSGSDCFLSMVESNNPNRYIVATNDKSLQFTLQKIPSVPVLYINRTSIILKPPSQSSIQLAEKKQKLAVGISGHQEKVLHSMKLKMFGCIPKPEKIEIPMKKCRGPNPLSCKKKKTLLKAELSESVKSNASKRRRKRIRIPAHVKSELLVATGT